MKTIHAFGDSFTVGDQEDFDQYKDFGERLEYVRYNISYISHVAKELRLNLVNHAERGSGNFPQIDKLYLGLISGDIKSTDVVFFGLSTSCRDRSSCIELPKSTSDSWGESVVDRNLLLSGDFQTISELDYFYALSVIDQLRKKFNIRIVVMQAFDHCLDQKPALKYLFKFEDFIGCDLINSTFIDILNDTWGRKDLKLLRGQNHVTLEVPDGYEHLYTKDRHPSIVGHKKIAQWILDNIKL